MSFLDAKPTDSKESLLDDILAAEANQSHRPGLPLRPLAALVVKVADETAETVADLKGHITRLNEQNAKLQWWVVALAVAALIGTVVQTGAALYALSASNSSSVTPAASPDHVPGTQRQLSQPAMRPSEPAVMKPMTGVSAPAALARPSSPSSASISEVQRQ